MTGLALQSLIVGLGRAGSGLHLPALRRLRGDGQPGQPGGCLTVGYDPRGVSCGPPAGELILADSLAHALTMLDPQRTVVHLCTPPVVRASLLGELAAAGFRKIIVEKPLAADAAEVKRIRSLRLRYRLGLQVVAPWLASTLTARLVDIVRSGELGGIRSVSVLQRKPRFGKSLADAGHPTAFDVEIPHALAVALRLAGDARVTGAACTDMLAGDMSIPWMGTARLLLRHKSGARTEIFSSLVSPSRERRISLRFDHGHVTGFYPESQSDNYAQIIVTKEAQKRLEIFPDDALATFLRGAYRRFAAGNATTQDFPLQARVVELLCDGKTLAGVDSAPREEEVPFEQGA